MRLWFVRPGTVVILLSGTLTTFERSLVAAGQPGTVLEWRRTVHDLLEPELRTLVEQELHRRTSAFVAGMDLKRDVVSLVLTLS